MTKDGSTSDESQAARRDQTPEGGDFSFTGRTTSDHRIEPDPGPAGAPDRMITVVDFTVPQALGPDASAALKRVHERYAELIARALSSRLGTTVQVKLKTIETLRLESFWERLEIPGACVHVNLSPAAIDAVIEFSPPTLLATLERLLGSTGKFDGEARVLTAIETRILGELTRRSAEALAAAFPGSQKAELAATASDPRELDLAGPAEIVVHVTFEVGFDGGAGPMSVAYRLETLKPLITVRRRDKPADAGGPTTRGVVEHLLGGACVPVSVELGSTDLTLGEAEMIRPGDVIPLDCRTGDGVEIKIGDEIHFRGQLGRVGTRSAVCVTRLAEEE